MERKIVAYRPVDGGDVFRRICEARINPAPAKKRKTASRRTRTPRPSRRSSMAAMRSVVAWGIVETVKRVNGKDEAIPFMGEPVPYESDADDYGLAGVM